MKKGQERSTLFWIIIMAIALVILITLAWKFGKALFSGGSGISFW